MLSASKIVRALSLGLLVALSSCGGGAPGDTQAGANPNNTGGVGTGGTGSYTNGPISGLGSIILNSVNRVRYDVDQALLNGQVSEDDGTPVPSGFNFGLGMVVEVDGSDFTASASSSSYTYDATATRVRLRSDLIGPVSAINPISGAVTSVTVLGQTVNINSRTVMPTALATGDVVVVYGLSDSTGFTATRIDKPSVSPVVYKIAALVSRVDSGAGSKLIYLGQGGGVAVSYQALSDGLPDGVEVGARVRVWFTITPVGGNWSATRIDVDRAFVQNTRDASLEGLLTQLRDINGLIKVNGAPVDVSGISPLPALVLGQRIEAEGRMQGGILVARELSIEDESDDEETSLELHGQLSLLDTSADTFVVRGTLVRYTTSLVSESALSVLPSPCVEVHGKQLNAQGELVATEIEVKRSCEDDGDD